MSGNLAKLGIAIIIICYRQQMPTINGNKEGVEGNLFNSINNYININIVK